MGKRKKQKQGKKNNNKDTRAHCRENAPRVKWECTSCTLVNHIDLHECELCGEPQPPFKPNRQSQLPSPYDTTTNATNRSCTKSRITSPTYDTTDDTTTDTTNDKQPKSSNSNSYLSQTNNKIVHAPPNNTQLKQKTTSTPKTNSQSKKETSWACSACTFSNSEHIDKCEMCQNPKQQ